LIQIASDSSAASPAEASSGRDAEVRASRLFALNVGLGVCGAVAIGVALRGGAHSVTVTPSARAAHFMLFGQQFSYPVVNLAGVVVLVLAALGAVVVCLALRGASRELRASRRFVLALRTRVVGRLGDVSVFDDEQAQAFCAGVLRPRVYVSTGAVRLLPADELRAVLAHERHHRDQRDPLRIALGRVMARALFFMPVLARLHARYCATAELAADDAAVRADGGCPSALASAMLVFDEDTHPAASVGIASERVDHLLGHDAPSPLPFALMAIGLGSAALIALAAWQVGAAALARATFNLPLLSTQPCIVTLALIPGALGALAWRYLRPLPRTE
jgi:Zn-dependent protease with chaperone function